MFQSKDSQILQNDVFTVTHLSSTSSVSLLSDLFYQREEKQAVYGLMGVHTIGLQRGRRVTTRQESKLFWKFQNTYK